MTRPLPDARGLFVGAAKVETMLRDFNRLRELIRSRGDDETQNAWDKCERWIGCINPTRED